jgi:hypothetical protein
MPTKSSADLSPLCKLTEAEAITLRRVAFGQSELRALRRKDIDRLRSLALIVVAKDEISSRRPDASSSNRCPAPSSPPPSVKETDGSEAPTS